MKAIINIINTINNKAPWLKNRYFLACFSFFIYVSFFDRNSILNQLEQKAEIKELKRQMEFYNKEIESTRKSLNDLTTNYETMENYARETFLMKKDNEDIFLVINE
jgi:cell division protein FtsB